MSLIEEGLAPEKDPPRSDLELSRDLIIPVRRPRLVVTSLWRLALSLHKFATVFGAIWAGVGAVMTVWFLVLAMLFPVFLVGFLVAISLLVLGVLMMSPGLLRAMHTRFVLEKGSLVRGEVVSVTEERGGWLRHERRRVPKTSRFSQDGGETWMRHKVVFAYRDAAGRRHTGERSFLPDKDNAWLTECSPGCELPVLVDPLSPSDVVVPSLLKVKFVRGEVPVDQRPQRVSREARARAPLTSFVAKLDSDSAFLSVPLWLRALRRQRDMVVGSLELSGHCLRQTTPSGQSEVDLSKAFRVLCTAWPVDDEALELNVTVRAVDAAPSDEGLAFKVRLAQSRVGREVEVKQETMPCLDAAAFEVVWEALVYHGEIHGVRLPSVAPAATRHGLARDALDTIEAAVAILEEARIFSSAAVGVAGTPVSNSAQKALSIIIGHGQQTTPWLLDLASSSNPVARFAAVEGLRHFPSEQGAQALGAMRRDTSIITRQDGCIRDQPRILFHAISALNAYPEKLKAIADSDIPSRFTAHLPFETTLRLSLNGSRSLEELSALTQLRSLEISGCAALQSLEGIAALRHLTSLTLSGCERLVSVDGMEKLTSLEVLDLSGASALKSLDLRGLPNLSTLKLGGCLSLRKVEGLTTLESLVTVRLDQRTPLEDECMSGFLEHFELTLFSPEHLFADFHKKTT